MTNTYRNRLYLLIATKQCHHKFGFIRDGIQEIETRRDEMRIKLGGERNKARMKVKNELRISTVKEESKMGEGRRRGRKIKAG